jgi:flagellar motor switch protein FliN
MIANEVELESLSEMKPNGKATLGSLAPFLASVKVQVAVRVGCAEISVGELLKLQQGEVLLLDRLVEQPLDVLVDGHVVARGSLVAVEEHFGVRITQSAQFDLPPSTRLAAGEDLPVTERASTPR